MSKPKITIIIPVYNVEQYLRQCLDSVVNQTMREIQIICVNDGSPDNSRSILQEYADKDSRIEIIDKTNGGISSARNAAYPHIRGKYTLFIDSDDWLELDLCEKTYQKSEITGAEMTVFFYSKEQDGSCPMSHISLQDKVTIEDKLPVLTHPTAWSKLWRTDFLLDNKLYFPEGLVWEDNLVHWQAVTLAEKISVLPEQLYHYRFRPASIMQISENSMQVIPIYSKIYEFLLESGYYATYREEFILRKLHVWCRHYSFLPTTMKPRFAAMIRESLTADDWQFLCIASKKQLSNTARLFYKMLDGSRTDALKYHFFESIKLPEQFLRKWIIKPIKKRLKAAKLHNSK